MLDHGDRHEEIALDKELAFAIVPRGTWHTARTKTGCRLLFITPGEGTQNQGKCERPGTHAMAELTTKPSRKSVQEFLKTVDDFQRRQDCGIVAALMRRATGKRATLWGDDIVGFGRYDYEHANGQPASWFLTGFSPRKRDMTIYIMPASRTTGS